jgi:hypothetical protein
MPATTSPSRRPRRTRPPVDDFAEFLTDAYAEWIEACAAQGWVAHFVSGPAAHAMVVYDLLSGPVEITDAGRPLPDSPTDVEQWLLVSRVGTRPLTGDATVREWVAAVAVLMAAGR